MRSKSAASALAIACRPGCPSGLPQSGSFRSAESMLCIDYVLNFSVDAVQTQRSIRAETESVDRRNQQTRCRHPQPKTRMDRVVELGSAFAAPADCPAIPAGSTRYHPAARPIGSIAFGLGILGFTSVCDRTHALFLARSGSGALVHFTETRSAE